MLNKYCAKYGTDQKRSTNCVLASKLHKAVKGCRFIKSLKNLQLKHELSSFLTFSELFHIFI